MSVVILDRDGVINHDSVDYIKSAEEWRPINGSIEAISILSKLGFAIYVATNQAGLARGLFSRSDLNEMHAKLSRMVEAAGGSISEIFYCHHHPDENCLCRKPKTGLLQQVANHCGENLAYQPFVGDSLKDIQAALAMGCQPVLVRTGNGLDTEKQISKDIPVFDDLLSFAQHALHVKVSYR